MKFPELKLLPTEEDTTWISVNERLPEPKTMCLVYNDIYGIDISYFTYKSIFTIDVTKDFGVTHWMKLPKKP